MSELKSGSVNAPIAAVMMDILVAEGSVVAEGDTLAILETVKVHTPVTTLITGQIAARHVQIGQAVSWVSCSSAYSSPLIRNEANRRINATPKACARRGKLWRTFAMPTASSSMASWRLRPSGNVAQ